MPAYVRTYVRNDFCAAEKLLLSRVRNGWRHLQPVPFKPLHPNLYNPEDPFQRPLLHRRSRMRLSTPHVFLAFDVELNFPSTLGRPLRLLTLRLRHRSERQSLWMGGSDCNTHVEHCGHPCARLCLARPNHSLGASLLLRIFLLFLPSDGSHQSLNRLYPA